VLLGFLQAAGIIFGYAYTVEMCPFENRNAVGSFLHLIDKVVMLASISYFKFIGVYWKDLIGPAIILSFLSVAVAAMLPDSP